MIIREYKITYYLSSRKSLYPQNNIHGIINSNGNAPRDNDSITIIFYHFFRSLFDIKKESWHTNENWHMKTIYYISQKSRPLFPTIRCPQNTSIINSPLIKSIVFQCLLSWTTLIFLLYITYIYILSSTCIYISRSV